MATSREARLRAIKLGCDIAGAYPSADDIVSH